MIILARFGTSRGPFCRDCGVANFRLLTANTLVLGWWGVISVMATPITLLINVARRRTVARLGPPQRVPGAYALLPAPLNPGKPLFAQPKTWAALLAALAIFALVAVSTFDSVQQERFQRVGGCTSGTRFVSCNEHHDGKIIEVTDQLMGCPPTDGYVKVGTTLYCTVDDD
jgi:hypothetical protein